MKILLDSSSNNVNNSDGSVGIHAGTKLSGYVLVPRSMMKDMTTTHQKEKGENQRKTDTSISNNNNDNSPLESSVYIELIGQEVSVVSTPYNDNNPGTYDLQWMKRNHSESTILYRKGKELFPNSTCTQQQQQQQQQQQEPKDKDEVEILHFPFEFDIPEHLPGSMKYIDKSCKVSYRIPHQLSISYKLEAHIPFTIHAATLGVTILPQVKVPTKVVNNIESDETESEKEENEAVLVAAETVAAAEEVEYDDFFHHLVYFYIGKVSPVPLTMRSYVCGLWNVRIKPHTLVPSEEPICLYPNQRMQIIIPDPNHQVFPKESQPPPQAENDKENQSRNDAINGNDTESRRSQTRSRRRIVVNLYQYLRWTAQHREKVEVETWSFTETKTTSTKSMTSKGRTSTTGSIEYEPNGYNDYENLYTEMEENKNKRRVIINGETRDGRKFGLSRSTNTANNADVFEDDTTSMRQENEKRQVMLDVPDTIRPSFKGKLIEVYHELIVSITNDVVSETIATSQSIPVHIVLKCATS